jgi:hypothetical protein
MSSPAPVRNRLEALLLAAAFAAAHTQSPLYFSNQNQYLLHGTALAGRGHLAHDWLATTRDPTPLFSLLVAAAYSVHPFLLHPAYFALLMSYFLASRWLVAAVPGFPDTRASRVVFAAAFAAAHAAILRWASVELTGGDYPWLLQAGLAAQYLLGPGIQPSAFGVLLLVAVAAFAHGRVVLACALAALACWFHSTYLLPAGLLVFGFVVESFRRAGARAAAVAGAVALGAVVPVVAFVAWRFDAFGPNAARATYILARVRIPHHCVPARWFDWLAGLQIAWMALGLFLVRRTAFGRALAVAAAGGAALTALQLATDSDALALTFPWRVSVLLVPVATAVVIAKALAWKRPGQRGERIALAGLLALVAGGIIVTVCGLGYRMVDEHELYDHVRATAGPDDVYLLPVQFPAVGTGRGAVSNTFAPPPRAKEGTSQIPVDLQRFRLATGARIYVDFKSVPYAAPEVEEWYRRMTFASELTAKGAWDTPGRREELKREGITHVVSPRSKPIAASYLAEEYSDAAYVVYRVK